MDAISVLLVDENPAFLRIVTRLLREYYQEQLTVVGTSLSNEGALYLACRLQPQIILMGVGQYSLAGLRLVARLRTALPTTGIVVLGSLDIRAYEQADRDAGADAFVDKVNLNRILPAVIRHIANDAATTHGAHQGVEHAHVSTNGGEGYGC